MSAHPSTPLILASASPRRRALLGALMASHGLPFTVATADVDEAIQPHELPAAAAVRLALAKALTVAATTGGRAVRVIGADTIVVARDDGAVHGHDAASGVANGKSVGTRTSPQDSLGMATRVRDTEALQWQGTGRHATILGKPRDAAEATAFLRRLRGRRHDVITGVAIVDAATGAHVTACATTAVWMRAYDDDEIAAYVASGDPMDKAGAYAIQHRGFHPVAGLMGSEANVIGLPVGLLGRMLLRGPSGQESLSARIDAARSAKARGTRTSTPRWSADP